MFNRNVINRHYNHSENPNPIWHLDRSVTVQVFEFDYICPNTGKVFKTRLYWKHDTNDNSHKNKNLYHCCSWRFMGYNPIPVTEWFHGLSKSQMFEWCAEHGLGNMKCIGQYIDFYYSDSCVWDSYNMEWVRRK